MNLKKRGLDIPAGILRKEELVEAIMSIKLEHLNYVYSAGTAYEKQALKDICLEIPHGEFVGVIGHTGSGKSTLIQHLNGLIRATSPEHCTITERIFTKTVII